MHFVPTFWSVHGLKMALCCFYQWSNQGIIMLSTYASRTIHIYWWLSDNYFIGKKISALWGTWHIIISGQIVASLQQLSLCMTKWLPKLRRGWRYFRPNTKSAKSLRSVKHLDMDLFILSYSLLDQLQYLDFKSTWSLSRFVSRRWLW